MVVKRTTSRCSTYDEYEPVLSDKSKWCDEKDMKHGEVYRCSSYSLPPCEDKEEIVGVVISWQEAKRIRMGVQEDFGIEWDEEHEKGARAEAKKNMTWLLIIYSSDQASWKRGTAYSVDRHWQYRVKLDEEEAKEYLRKAMLMSGEEEE